MIRVSFPAHRFQQAEAAHAAAVARYPAGSVSPLEFIGKYVYTVQLP